MPLLPIFSARSSSYETCGRLLPFAVVVPGVALAQKPTVESRKTDEAQRGKIKICHGVPIPDGYLIAAFQPHAACPQGAYILQKEKLVGVSQSPAVKAIASRERKVNDPIASPLAGDTSNSRRRR